MALQLPDSTSTSHSQRPRDNGASAGRDSRGSGSSATPISRGASDGGDDLQSRLTKQKAGKLGKMSVLKKLASRRKQPSQEDGTAISSVAKAIPATVVSRNRSDVAKKLSASIPRGMAASLVERHDREVDIDGDMAAMSEAGLHDLRTELTELDAEVSLELRRTVADNYKPFIQASQGIGKLEVEMQELRTTLAAYTSMMSSLRGLAASTPSQFAAEAEASASAMEAPLDWRDLKAGQSWAESLDNVDSAMAERRTLDALNALKTAQRLVVTVPPSEERLTDEDPGEELESRRLQLLPLLEAQVGDAGSSAAEVRLAVGLLAALTGRTHAIRSLLASHSQHLKRTQMSALKPQNTGRGEADGTDLAGAMAQHVFGAIGAAADDTKIVFGEGGSDISALFLVWALAETERSTLLLKRHVLTPFAVPAGLGPTVRCMLLMHVHATALQITHGISVGPRITRDLWPVVDQVLQRRLRRIGHDLQKEVTSEVEKVANEGLKPPGGKTGWGKLMVNFSSADDLLDEVNSVVATLAPLPIPQVAVALRQGFVELFTAYSNALTSAFAKYKGSNGRLPESLDPAVDDAVETASLLVEQFLPEALQPLHEALGDAVLDGPALEASLEALGKALGLVMTELPRA